MIPAQFEYHAPTSLRQAVNLLRRYSDEAKVLAGGQSLIPAMRLRLAQPGHLVDLGRIAGLDYIQERDGGLAIGAMTTYARLETSPLVQRDLFALVEATRVVADVQVRNKGTLGGSLAHADPVADLPAVVVAAEARINVVGGRRSRSVAADRFFVDVFTTSLGETEVVREVFFPALPPGTGGTYQKFANKASHFAVVGVAAFVTLDGQGLCQRVRLGITGVGARATRARAAERFLEGKEPSEGNLEQAARRATRGIEFQGDIHGSEEYREHLTRVFTFRALGEAVRRAGR